MLLGVGVFCVFAIADRSLGPFDWFLERDSTDGEKRSGLVLKTDALTGCQYLKSGNAMIPRVDSKGQHICGAAND